MVKVMNVGDVRSKEHLGIVTSDTSTGKVSFFVTPMKNRVGIVEGDFVVIDHPTLGELCPLIAVVKGISNFEEVVGTTLGEKAVETAATAEILGFVDLRSDSWHLERLIVPPTPGSKVYLPYFEFLEEAFLRDTDGKRLERALHLGLLEAHSVSRNGVSKTLNFYLSFGDFRKQHFLVAGMTGSGKTHVATVVVEELANKTDLPVVILDSFGEYASVGFTGKHFDELQKTGAISVKEYPFNFGVSVFAIEPEEVKRKLEKNGISAKKSDRFSITAFSNNWNDFPNQKAAEAIGEEICDTVKPNQVLVLDGVGLGLADRRRLFSSCITALLNKRDKGSIDPFVLIVEESEAVDTELLDRIALEGRKTGVSMCLLSQHPSVISGKVLSQMGTQIMGRMTDNEDLDHLKVAAEEKLTHLPRLRQGEWIINGVTVGRPMKVMVRAGYSTVA